MKKYFIFLLTFLIFSCKEDLSGHWHLKNLDTKNTSVMSVDILKNDDCYLYYSLSGKPIKGKHFPKEKQIFFPGQCGQYSFNYIYKHNKIYLASDLGEELIAEEQKNACDIFNDYKTLLNINYLKIKTKRKVYNPKDSIGNEGLNEYINISFSEESNSIRIEYFNKINTIDKIDDIIKYIENSVSDAEIPFINYVLTPDRNLKASDLKIIIDRFNNGYKKKIFIQTLKIKPKNRNVFEYIKINELELKSDNKLFNILY